MMRKKIAGLLAACLALTVLTACGKKQASSDRLDQIREKGELVIALEGNWAPWSFHDDSDTLVGYDV